MGRLLIAICILTIFSSCSPSESRRKSVEDIGTIIYQRIPNLTTRSDTLVVKCSDDTYKIIFMDAHGKIDEIDKLDIKIGDTNEPE